MANTCDALSYPVLCISRSTGVFVAKNPAELERCRAVVFGKARFYDGLRIVDSSGREYRVTNASVVKPKSAAAQWIAKFLDLSIHTHIEMEDLGIASLSDVVRAVETSLQEDAETFEEFSGKSVEWWRGVLAKSVSIRDILKAFSEPTPG